MFLSLAVNLIFFPLSSSSQFFFPPYFLALFFSFPCCLGAVLTVRDVITRRVLRIRIQKLQPFFHPNRLTLAHTLVYFIFFSLVGFTSPVFRNYDFFFFYSRLCILRANVRIFRQDAKLADSGGVGHARAGAFSFLSSAMRGRLLVARWPHPPIPRINKRE